MNKRQWQILAIGTLAAVSVPAFNPSPPRPPIIGPRVEYADGHYTQDIKMAPTPWSSLYASLGLAVLTVTAVYKSRTKRADA